jgi:hypothetical protein
MSHETKAPLASWLHRLAATAAGLTIVVCAAQAARADDVFSRLTLSFTPKYVKSTQSDQRDPSAVPGTGATNTLHLDYGAVYRLDRRDSVSYDNVNAAFTLGRVYLPTAQGAYPLYVGAVVDRMQTLAIRRKFNSALQLNAGYYWRSRSCCPGDNDPNAPLHAGYGGDFIGAEMNFADLPRGGPLFTYSVRALYVPHHATAALQAQYLGTTIASNRFILPQTLVFHVPFPWDRKLHPFIAYTHGANFFNNEAMPEQQNIMNYGFVRPVGRNIAFRAAIFNLKQTHQAATFPGQETARYSTFDAGLTYTPSL